MALMVWCVRIPVGIAVLCTVVLGAVDEISQMFMTGRSPHMRDLLADTAGELLCMATMAVLGRRKSEEIQKD